jgi:hypothetical protein
MKTFIYTILLLIMISCESREKEIFVLPEGYTGQVVVLLDQENGEEKIYHNGSRVYEIPKDGILRSKFTTNPGWNDPDQFYYAGIGDDNRIPYVWEWDSVSANNINVCCLSNGQALKNSDKTPVNFITFYVGTKDQIKKAITEGDDKHIADYVE